MIYFRKVIDGLLVKPLLAQLARCPELWGAPSEWTHGKERFSVIHQADLAKSHIVLRYNRTPPGRLLSPRHWDRPAIFALTEARLLALQVLISAGVQPPIGRMTISRLPPGGRILPHIHLVEGGRPRIFDTYQIPLQVDEGVLFGCGHEAIWMQPGTAWTFDNQLTTGRGGHWVENNSQRDRISLMVDLRCAPHLFKEGYVRHMDCDPQHFGADGYDYRPSP